MNSFWALLDSIPEDSIAITVYLLGSVIALLCWYGVMKRIPKPFGGIGWLLAFAVLLTPTVSEGTNASVAPAIFGSPPAPALLQWPPQRVHDPHFPAPNRIPTA